MCSKIKYAFTCFINTTFKFTLRLYLRHSYTFRGCEKNIDSNAEMKKEMSHSRDLFRPNTPAISTVNQNVTATVQKQITYPTYTNQCGKRRAFFFFLS